MSSRMGSDVSAVLVGRGCIDSTDEPLVAEVFRKEFGWTGTGKVSGTYWQFWVYGKEVAWEDLTDEQRCKVRMAGAWEGRVRDYWEQLRYKDDSWYTLEVLEGL